MRPCRTCHTGRALACSCPATRPPSRLPITSGQGAGTDANVLKLDFVGGNTNATVSGQQQLSSTSNYFNGSDPSGWIQYVPNYSQVVIQNIYPGIDVEFSGTDSRTLEYSFIVHPGANPNVINLNWEGVNGLSTDQQGNLDLATSAGTVMENAPSSYQLGSGGVQQAVATSTVINNDGTVGFSVGSYNTSQNLVIDPVLGFGSYLGGSGTDQAYGVAVDPSGETIVAGTTTSSNFPTTTGVVSGYFAGSTANAFVTKLDAAGTGVVYSTYFNYGSSTNAYAVATDAAGNAYVAGQANYTTTDGILFKLAPPAAS